VFGVRGEFMNVTIFGSGYVGLVTGACLAESGHDVLCVDIDVDKIARLQRGDVPIYEPGLEAMIVKNQADQRLKFTTDVSLGVQHGLFQFIAVGTPPDEDGSADLQYVLAVAESIASEMTEYRVIVDKSTVPVGTGAKVHACVEKILKARQCDVVFDVVSNPEFLKEGVAIADFMKPDRIVVGVESAQAKKLLGRLYEPFNRNRERILYMDIPSAELTKYAANSMLATRISFMNELANISESLGANIEQVRKGIGSDSRIGYQFIYPGCGYGGSCFPKDVKALVYSAEQLGHDVGLLKAVEHVNDAQKKRMFDKIHAYFLGDIRGRTVALWGLAFKPGTDDMREAPSRVLMELLWQAGATVQAFDPVANEEAERIYGQREDLRLCESPEAALDGADVLVIVTEWRVFSGVKFEIIKEKLRYGVVFDGRNIYKPKDMQEFGLEYYSIGRKPLRLTGQA